MAERREFRQTRAERERLVELSPEVRFSDASARAAEDFANTMFRFSSRLEDRIDAQTVQRAEVAGAIAGRRPDFQPAEDATLAARAFNRSARQSFIAELEVRARSRLDELAEQHRGDPVALEQALEGYAGGMAERLAEQDEQLVAPFRAIYARHALPLIRQAGDVARKLQADEAAAATNDAATSIMLNAERLARIAAFDSGAAADLAAEREHLIGLFAESGPAAEFTFAGRTFEADADRPGAFSVEEMQSALERFDKRVHAERAMGAFDRAPDKRRFIEEFKDREAGRSDSPLTLPEVEQLARRMRGQINVDQGERRRVRRLIDDHVASVEKTGIGVDDMRVQARNVLPEDEYREFLERERLAREVHETTESLRFATPEQMREEIAAFRPEPGSEGFADRQDVFEKLAGRGEQLLAARRDDPAGYAMTAPEVRETFERAQQQPGDMPFAVSKSLALQQELGIPKRSRRALTVRQAKEAVAEIQALPATERGDRLSQLEALYGQHYDRVFKELVAAGLDSGNAVLGLVADDPALSAQVAQVIELGRSEITTTMEQAEVDGVERQVIDKLDAFRSVFEAGDFTGGATEAFNGIQRVVADVALLYMRRGEVTSRAVERAVSGVLLNRFSIIDNPAGTVRAYVPRVVEGTAIDMAKVEAFARETQNRSVLETLDVAPFGSVDPRVDEELSMERTLRTAENSGFWVTNEEADGLVLMVPFEGGGALPLMRRNGEPVEIGFVEATNSGALTLDVPPGVLPGFLTPTGPGARTALRGMP